MAFATADVVPNPGGEKPFRVVFKQGLTILSEWQVNSIEEGEQQIVKVLRALASRPSNSQVTR